MKYFVIKSPHQVGNSFLLNLFPLEETIKQSKQTFILKMTFIIVFIESSIHVQIFCVYLSWKSDIVHNFPKYGIFMA